MTIARTLQKCDVFVKVSNAILIFTDKNVNFPKKKKKLQGKLSLISRLCSKYTFRVKIKRETILYY